jgi:putative FmdB family regulatory protein
MSFGDFTMPLYVYECPEGHRKDAFRSISDRNNAPECDCGLSMQKVILPVMFNESFLGSSKNEGYKCPVTNEWVDSKRKRLNIMDKHDLVEYAGTKP